jgi:hypothetical protein
MSSALIGADVKSWGFESLSAMTKRVTRRPT